jgi:hypothetical protein
MVKGGKHDRAREDMQRMVGFEIRTCLVGTGAIDLEVPGHDAGRAP